MISFSDFINILHSHISGGKTIIDFVIEITDNIVEEPPTTKTTQADAETQYNPLSNKGPDMLYKICRGEKALPKKDAQTILTHIDPDRFRSYLLHFPNAAIEKVGSELQEKKVEKCFDDEGFYDIERTCIELFTKIIENCAQKKTYKT